MGLSSSTNKSKTTENTQQTGTTTPVNPPWVSDAIEQYTNQLGAFGDMDPNSFVAGPAPLQQMAWGNANSLGDWQPQARLASQQALNVIQNETPQLGPAATFNPVSAQSTGFNAPQLGQAPQSQAASYAAPTLGQANTYTAPSAGTGALVGARGYTAPALGSAIGYAAPRVGAPIGAQAQGYTTQPTDRTMLGPTANATASDASAQSLLTGMSNYQNPFNNEVTSRALQDFDMDAERTRARQMAEGARAGAFGGSRFGIAQAQTEGELARARGSLDAGLRAQGFDTAAALSGQDAGRRQDTSLFNAQNQTGISALNAGAANARGLAQGSLDSQRSLFDSGARTEAAAALAGARNTASIFNSGQDQQTKLAQAGMDEAGARYTADLSNRFTEKRADMAADAGKFSTGLAAEADRANMLSKNDLSMFNATQGAQAAADAAAARNNFAFKGADMAADAGQYNATNRQQTGLANQDMAGRFALTQGQMGFDAASQNAQAANAYGLSNQDAAMRAAEANAAARNQYGLAQAGFEDSAQARQLQGAGMLGDIANQYGAGVRDDLSMMAGLGDQQRMIEQQYAMAPLAQLQELGNLYGTTPYGLFSGQNVNTTGSMTGTNTTKTSPSLFGMMMEMGNKAAQAYGAGSG